MHVKRLYRPTVREALAAARETLGPAALVLSTELVPAPGWRGWVGQRMVRLTAATERMPDGESATAAEENPDELVSDDRTDVTVHRHLTTLSGPKAGVAARLAAAGLDRAFAEAVAARLSTAECRMASDIALRRALAAELDAAHPAGEAFGRYEVFVGPPGVGKTTTIAKIAAQERASGGRGLCLVATDAFRAGAVQQLSSYATVMSAPFRVARTPGELGEALDASRHTALIDTAGRSGADDAISDVLEALKGRRNVRTHLVLAADTSPATAKRILSRYTVAQPTHAVITKLDEADTMLPLFNVLREHGLPISYIGAGQRVPEDLDRATPATLASLLLRDTSREAVCH